MIIYASSTKKVDKKILIPEWDKVNKNICSFLFTPVIPRL